MGLLCSKSRIFSSPSPLTNPTITTAPPINWNLGNANEFKLLQLPLPQLVISARYADPTPYYSILGPYKQAITFSIWQLYNPLVWVVLKNPPRIYIVNILLVSVRDFYLIVSNNILEMLLKTMTDLQCAPFNYVV